MDLISIVQAAMKIDWIHKDYNFLSHHCLEHGFQPDGQMPSDKTVAETTPSTSFSVRRCRKTRPSCCVPGP
ncbi:hypothetical protein EZV62_019330 [Acer yangbiense]|uniref:Uncharacterized protein n=1 Tax=Acer yangbiense TaxID=1000413 RepID=A0A5C7HAU1_9ROSI|nr:hypothetical protein EZV62_019330 [Acer yangbiense]